MRPDGQASILLVEDEESLADTVRYNLEREGYAVRVSRRWPRSVGDGSARRPPTW